MGGFPDRPIAILAGGGGLPQLLADAARRNGRSATIFAIAGEADPAAFQRSPVHRIRWGEIGRLFRLAEDAGCRDAVFIGAIRQRPDFRALRPDLGALALAPRIIRLMRGGDDAVLSGVAAIFQEHGIELRSPLEIAPELALPGGVTVGELRRDDRVDIDAASEAARMVGRLDIGQGAVAIDGRVVAVEDAGGTDDLLHRICELRETGRIPKAGGVLVKRMKPQQDARLDVPTIGPATAEKARAAKLRGVAAEAGRTLLAGTHETADAFRRAGLFLFGIGIPDAETHG